MDPAELRKFFHDLRNALNAANIAANHLGLHAREESKPIIERLEKALDEAAQQVRDFEAKMQDTCASK